MMPAWMLYLLQLTVYTGVCWLIYRLLLHNRPAHGPNRSFLLSALVLPLLLPFGRLPLPERALPAQAVIRLPELQAGAPAPAGDAFRTGPLLLQAGYLVVAGLLLLRWLLGYVRLRRLLRTGSAEQKDGYQLLKGVGMGPGSFGRTVFFPEAIIDPALLRHELAHIRYGHRYDLVLTGLLQCLCWPNVFLHLLVRELRMVHEFQADAAAYSGDLPRYAERLLGHIFSTTAFPLSHSFYHQPIKRRIMMLQKTRRPFVRAVALTAAFSLTVLFSAATLWAQSGQKTGTKQPAPSRQEVLSHAEQMPEFQGDVMAWLTKNLKYPEEARNELKQGRVIVKFVVDNQGNVTQPEVAKSSAEPLLDKEALRVVTSMPKWKPGVKDGKPVSVYYYLPIAFKL